MTKRVLVTGHAGFIGSHTVQHFLDKTDWEVIGIDSFEHKGDPLRISDFDYPWERFKTYACDLSVPIGARLESRLGKVDAIINMASESHVDRSIEDPVPFVQNNINLTLNMLEYARRVKPEVFIQVSTDEVYGAAGANHTFKEWDTLLPSNPYSASKAAQEMLAISYWRTYGLPVTITNTVNNFGERQDAEKFIPLVIKKILNDEVVDIHQTGSQGSRFYIHARNHADALKFIIENHLTNVYAPRHRRPIKLNVCDSVELTNLEMAQLIADIMGRDLKYRIVDVHSGRPGHDPRYSLDGSKLRMWGWSPPVAFRDSLRKTVEWTIRDENREWLL